MSYIPNVIYKTGRIKPYDLMRLNVKNTRILDIIFVTACFIRLETVMRERFVRFSHTVHVFTFFDCSTFTFRCIKQLASKT